LIQQLKCFGDFFEVLGDVGIDATGAGGKEGEPLTKLYVPDRIPDSGVRFGSFDDGCSGGAQIDGDFAIENACGAVGGESFGAVVKIGDGVTLGGDEGAFHEFEGGFHGGAVAVASSEGEDWIAADDVSTAFGGEGVRGFEPVELWKLG